MESSVHHAVDTLAQWASTTAAAQLVRTSIWFSPALEVLHFFGTALLFGVVLMIDLQVLGFGPRLQAHSLRPFIPWALVGFSVNLISGALLVSAQPQSFIRNPAFEIKMVCILIAGANALWSQVVGAPIRAGDRPDTGHFRRLAIALAAVSSLVLWSIVIACGRLIPYFPGS